MENKNKPDGRGVAQMKSARNFLKSGALEARMASNVVGTSYTNAQKIIKASLASVSPPSLITAALDYDEATQTLTAGDHTTYSIRKYL